MNKYLVDNTYQLEKFPGKGGWTYAKIPEIAQNKKNPFGWVKVKGFIDDIEIKDYRLMPMGNGSLFLPVKAEIRKKIKKIEGDFIHVKLMEDNNPIEIPLEFQLCLQDDPIALEVFSLFTDDEKRAYISWIYSAKKEETRIERIATSINKISKNLKFNTKINF